MEKELKKWLLLAIIVAFIGGILSFVIGTALGSVCQF